MDMIAHLTDGTEILDTVDVDAQELAERNAAANECELFYITEEDREHADLLAEARRQKLEGLSAYEAGLWMGWMLPLVAADRDEEPFMFSHPRNGWGL